MYNPSCKKEAYLLNTRIKQIRRTLDLTQQEFAERIGLKQNSIALIESGKRNISDQAVLSICREFKVNEEWLRNGTGEMFVPDPGNELDALAEKYHLSAADQTLIEKYVNLKPDSRKAVMDFIADVAATLNGTDIYADIPDTPEEPERNYPPVEMPKRKEGQAG